MAALLIHDSRLLHLTRNDVLHAEYRLLAECPPPANSTVLVYRFRVDGSLGSSKPCQTCKDVLVAAGVEHVEFLDCDDARSESFYFRKCPPYGIKNPKPASLYPSRSFLLNTINQHA